MKNETRGRPSKGLSTGKIGLFIGEDNKQWMNENVENISVFIRELVEKEINRRDDISGVFLTEEETNFLSYVNNNIDTYDVDKGSKVFNTMFNRSVGNLGFKKLLGLVNEKK